jgi:hypothetical protein
MLAELGRGDHAAWGIGLARAAPASTHRWAVFSVGSCMRQIVKACATAGLRPLKRGDPEMGFRGLNENRISNDAFIR